VKSNKKIIRVAIPLKTNPFDYSVPKEFENDIGIGSLVIVNVRNQSFLGLVTEFINDSPFKLRDIHSLYEKINLGEDYVDFLNWISSYYFLTKGKVLEFMLPIKLNQQEKVNHSLKKETLIKKTDDFEISIALNSFTRLSQKEVVQFIDSEDEVYLKDLKEKYKSRIKTILPKLIELGFVEEKDITVFTTQDNILKPSRFPNIIPTEEQNVVINDILPYIKDGKYMTYLIEGVTGSGKTEIYYQLIKKTIEMGKTVLILLPEIALTDQTVAYFLDLVDFSEIALIHSHLTPSQKSNYWYQIAQDKIKLVIGARSALFAPLKNMGLIIVDEEQDSSYKQSDTAFRYNARDLAVLKSNFQSIPIVLGTATPSLETKFNVINKKYQHGVLLNRVNQKPLPDIEIVDLRDKEVLLEDTLISKPLYWALKETIKKKEQAIIYLNKRGYHAHFLCQDCGYTFKCENCDVSYTYYKYDNLLKCHYCGQSVPKPDFCPECQSKRITNLSVGTEKVVEDLNNLFEGEARIKRLDRDIVSTHKALGETISQMKNKEIDILVGTQMIVKGHHFPAVTLVAVLVADKGLHFPDIRAAERTFQDFIQVSGRAGRADKKGKIILQTYNTDHYAIQYFRDGQFDEFWTHELEWRKALSYPPYIKITKIIFSSEKKELLEDEMLRINRYKPIVANYLEAREADIYKIKNRYRYLIVISSDSPKKISKEITSILKFIEGIKLHKDISVIIDRDPL
jgi:primosomal protein N' (replication factor Y)